MHRDAEGREELVLPLVDRIEPEWERYQVTADDIPRDFTALIETTRAIRGERGVRQEYFCSFEDDADAFFKVEDLERSLTLADTSVPPLFPEAMG
jgi:hypothetical protein